MSGLIDCLVLFNEIPRQVRDANLPTHSRAIPGSAMQAFALRQTVAHHVPC